MARGGHDTTAFTTIEIDRALLILAYSGGNTWHAHDWMTKANEELVEKGEEPLRIPSQVTLTKWKKTKLERYVQLQTDHGADIEAIAVTQARDTAIRAGSLEARLLEKIEEHIDEIAPKDLAATLQRISITRGVSVDKLLLLTDRPTSITDKRDLAAIMEAIRRKAPGLIAGDAEEIAPGQLPTGSDDGVSSRDASILAEPDQG